MKAIIKTKNIANKLRISFQRVNEITNNTINSYTNFSNTKNFLFDTLFKKQLMNMSIYQNLTKNLCSVNGNQFDNLSILRFGEDKNNMNKNNQGLEKENIDRKFNSDRKNDNGGKLFLILFLIFNFYLFYFRGR